VTYARFHINTIDSPDDEHKGAQNMHRIGINIFEKRIVRQVGYLEEFTLVSFIKTSQLMLYREIIAVCSEIHTKYINTVYGQNVEMLNVKRCGTSSNHSIVKG
jgi:hypothetical protein